MPNPFEKYIQASERQNNKLNTTLDEWANTPSTLHARKDYTLTGQFEEALNRKDIVTEAIPTKSAGDLLVDAAASALKIPTIVGGVAVGAADLALSAASKPIEGYMRIGNALAPDLIPEPMDVGYGYIAKGLHDTIGYRPEEAKAFIDEKLFSDARKIQEKEYQSGYTAAEDKAFQDSWTKDYQAQYLDLQQSGATEQQLKDFTTGFNQHFQQAATQRADKYQTSWDKPLSENIDIIGHGFDNLLENPSLALGGAIESAGYLLPSMAVSRGVMALEKAAKVAKLGAGGVGAIQPLHRFAAAGVGEGSVAGTVSLEQMRSQMPDGIAGGRELLGALGVAASIGLIGTGFGKAASKLGVGDIDSVGLGRAASQAAAMKLPALARPVGAVTQESAEEFAQTFGESIIPNVTMGKDPLEGLGQELPMGTMAGAIMGAGMNAPSLVTGGFSDISSGLGKVKGAVSDAANLKSFDTLSNPEHKNYNPAQAFNIQLKNLESNDETVRTQAEASVSKIETDLNTARASVEKRIKSIQATLKAMPPSDQTTDAQKLEIEALGKEYSALTTKSSTLADQYVAFLDAQVAAQDHRDAQQGTQFTEEQAKADIATLTQPQTSTVMTVGDTQIPVQVEGDPKVLADGIEKVIVNYTDEQGNVKKEVVPTSSLASVESTDTTAQQEALNRVTRHFSKYSNDDLDLLATSPVFNEAQRNSLRLMSKSKRELAAVQDPSQVFDNILNGYKGKTIQESHRGLNQYTDMVNTAVATKNTQLADLALNGLGAFTDDHTAKRDAINEAFGLVQKGTYKEIRVVRTEDGTWGFVPFTAQEVRVGKNADGVVFLEDDALKEALNEVGGFNVHINSDKPTKGRTIGAITQINNETQLIQDRFNALSGVAESFVGVTPKPVDTSTAPIVDTPIVTEPSDTTAPVDNPAPEAPVQSGAPATPTEPIETVADSEQQLSSLTKTASDTVKLPSDYGQSDIFKAVPLFKKENPTGIIAFRVNSKRTLLESLKDANAIGNPFNWQNPKIGAGNATKMFDEWLRTGKHTDHAEAPQATEEYRQAILSKLKENPTAKILYYKELNGASHANVLEHIAKGMQQTATPTETKTPVQAEVTTTPSQDTTDVTEGVNQVAGTKQLAEVLTTQQSKASDVLTELKDSDSSRLPKEYKAYLDTLLEQVVKVFPDTLVQFVKDISEIPKKYGIEEFFFGKQGTFNDEKFVFIRQVEKTASSDRHEVTVHEFIHVATADYIENKFSGTQSKTVRSLLDAARAYVRTFKGKTTDGVKVLTHVLNKEGTYVQSKELLAYGLTHPALVAELQKIPYIWTSANGGIGTIASSMLEVVEPTNVYEALLVAYGNILEIEESKLESTKDNTTTEATQGLAVRTGNTSESTTESEPDVQGTDGGTGTGNVEVEQTSTESQEVTPLKPEFQGKVILAHAGTGKSFATKSNPDLIDGDVLYYQATNTIVDKYNEANNESVPNIENVTGTRGVFEAWGEYGDKAATKALESLKAVYAFEDIELADVTSKEVKQWKAVTNDKKLNRPQSSIDALNGHIAEIESYLNNKTEIDSRKAEAVRRRKEIYREYAKQARALADAGKTVLSSSIREELIAVADMVVIQNDAKFIAKNLTSAERVNQNSETDLVKIQGKIDKAKNAASKNPNLKAYTLEKEEYISDLIFEEPAAPKDAKVTVLQGVTNEIAAEERKKPFNLRNILKGYFTQSTTKEDATGANPLVTVKDFISNFDVPTQVNKWLNDRRKPTEKQLAQVEHFKKFHAEFSKALKFVFNTQASAIFVSNRENLVGYMEMGKKASTRELDENVVTALALSAYSYLIKQGNKVMNTNEELETLFRFKKGMRAPLHIEQMFRFAGQEMPIVVKALGTDTAKALGLKVREDQDPTLQDRLNTALGILAMEAMAKAGFVVIDTLEGKPLTDFLTAIKTVRESKAHTSEDEYDFEVDTDVETKISKFTMVRPNAKMEGKGNSVFEKGIIETEVDGKIVRTETITLNRPVLTEGLPTLNSPLVNELIEANKDTKGFLSYLFGVDVGLTTPLKEIPKKFTQKLINGTDASVPSVQAELLTEAQKHSFTMRTNTVAVFAAMQKLGENSQFLKELLGIWIDDHVLSRTHVTERDSLQAKAQNDWTAVLNGLEWADATLDENGQYTQFYDTQFVAQNQRQHLNANMFSAQSSQIHRAMAALTGFSTTIDLSQDEQGTVKDEALLNLFYQAVGEGLEGLDDYLKADILAKAGAGLHQFFTVDKVYGDYYVPALKAFLQTEDSQNAIKAMRVLIETGTIDATQQKAIAWFVEKGEMGAQSLQSLIALAELDIAQANGTTFTTTIGFGSDGVNHGVSAANMLTGVISKDMRKQTGIFPIAEKGEDQIDNMQEVYRRGVTDYYVDFGKVMAAKLRDLIPTFVGKLNTDFVEGMQALFPKFEALDETGVLKNLLAMRKMAKIWAIPFNYSAGKAALQRALARGFLAGIYGEMNKLANEALDIIDAKKKEGLTAEQLAALDVKLETVKLKTKTLEENLNKVLGKYGTSVTLPEEPQLLNEEDKGKLSNELENTLMQAAIDLHGEAAWKATEEFAKDYLQVRNVYTEVEKASFTLFDVVRNQLIEEKKASRKYTNVDAKVQVKGKTVQYTAEELNAQEAEYFGLTTVEIAEVDAALAAMRPMFNTALSIGSESTNAADSVTNPSGVSVRKHKMQREPAKGLRAVNTFYLKEIDANRKPFSEARNIGLTKEVEENAGVASSANAIQSIDAFVAAKVQAFMDALNVHDAAIFGLKNFLKGVKKQNEEHLRALTNYQLGLEHAKMLVKVYVGYKAFMATQEEALKSEDVMVKENAQKLITKAKKQMEVLLQGEQMFKGDTALKINNQLVYKGGLIPKLQAANLDIKDSASIEEAISVFINFALKQDLQKLEVLLDTYSIHQFAGEGGMHQLTKADKASIEKQKALVQKALSDLGTELTDKAAPMNTTEAVKPITELAKFLRKAKGAVIDITSLIEHLTNNTDIADPKARAAQLEVLKAITPLIDKATKVIYSEGKDYDGYGYYDETTNILHINSAKEAEGGVRSTLAVHELLHAALSRRIKTLRTAIKNNSGEHPEAVAALKRLDALRINLVTPAGMKMLELRAELGSAIEDSVKFYTDQDALIASLKEQVAISLRELQQFNKDKAKPDVLAAKAKEWNSLKTELANAQATLAKADQYLKLRKLLKAKVLSQHTRKDGSISKFTQLDLVNQLESTDEFISHGLTESRLRQVLSKKTVVAAFRSFVKLVGQLLGFSSNQVNALEAFASDTAALLETIGSVTPVVASNNGERLFSTQSAENQVNTKPEISKALEQAREAVRELLTQLNFKFVDSPDVNLSDIERIASKYLTEGESNNDPAFLKDAAISLSYAIYFELGLPQGNAKMRKWLEQSLLDWLTTGEVPKLHKSVWVKVVEVFNKLMAAFSGKEFKAIESRLEATLNKIINREDFSFKPKQGYAKLVFQKEMTNNPLAVQSLLTFIKSGIKFALTGSVAYADQVPLYRQENKPLHDMDFLVAPEDLQDAYDYFTQKDPDNWGGAFTLYDVVKEGKRILGFAIVPKGFVIKNGKSEWNREQKAPERSYDVFNVVTGLKAGSYYFLGGKEEVFTGIAGITIDLLAEDARDTVTQTFKDTTGTNKSIEVSSYVGGFTAKLDMLRLKDITDFIGVVPPTERVLSKPKAVKPTEEPIAKPAPAVNTIAQYQAEAAALEDDALDVALSGLLDKQRKGDKSPLLKMKFKAYNDEMNKRGADVSNKGERRYSKNTLSGNGLTVASTRQILVKQFGEKLIKALEAKGLLRIVETMAETPEAALESNTEGYYLNGKATLVVDGLTPETVVATLLHELSGHKGFQELMEPAAYNALMKQFDKLVAEGNPIALAALKRAQEATGSDGKPLSLQGQMDEYLPYLLTIQATINATQAQKSAITKFLDNVFSAVRAWAYKKLQANGYEGAASAFMQPQDIVYMAERMLREMANNPVTSSNTQSPIKFSTKSAEDLVNGQSSLDIMTALPHSNTGAFNQQLDRLIVEEIGQLYNQDDAAKARIDEIQTFTASDALNAGFALSRKEQYVQQALQYAVAAYMKLHAGGANVGQLRRVYHAAKAKMDVTGKDFHEGDWATATQQERDIAKAKYDFMFDSTKEGYMSRFVSMALASEAVNKLLDIALPLTKPDTQDKTWFEKVNDWVSYVMAWLTNKYVRLNPVAGASNQLVQLMDNLVKLDIRNRQEGVALHQKAWNTIGLVTTPLNKALKGAGGALLSGVGLRESRFLPVRALGAILVLRSEEAAKAIPKMIIDMRNNQLPNTKLGEVANILLEASGVGTLRDKFDVLIRQTNLNAKNRQDIVDNVKKAVNTWFKAPLTKAQHAAVAYGLLGTDAQALLENYSVEDIVDMALHEGKLNAEIAKLKKEIAKNPNGNDMLNAAEQLGYYMVTRIGGEGLVKNALGIAIGLGTQYFTSVEQADPKLVGQLNTLVSMLAMTHVPNSDKAILAALYKTDAEGVHATIQLHQGLVNDSLKDFQANPLNMVKGWMPEVTNPYLEIKAANSKVEREQMEAEGWVLIDELKRDKHDKGSPKYLMKHNDIGYQRLVSGAVDLGSTARSGTEAISRTSPKYLGITQARYQNAARRAAIPNSSFDPSKQPRGLIAAYDTNGMALAYNYEMDNETRDAHLDRKHNIGDLLGTFGGLNYYKPEKAKQSNTVAEVLFEDYKANYSQNPNAYLKISHKSTDPKVVEMWRMLPQDFKQRATELYGKGNPIIIRNEAFNLAFGFKKFSVVSYAFDAVKAERERIKNGLVGTGKAPNAFQSGFVRLAEATRKGTAQADFAKAEHVVQEIVKAIKDFIVIRSGTTMMWNIFANVLMLMANGINPVTIVKDWVFAVTNVRAYQKLNSQLIQAQADLAGGKDPIALKQRIGALKAELKANVMNPYINAGLLSSIVEDVNIQQGEYTYASAFKQTVDEKTQWIPKPVKTAAAVLTIAPSTKLYQFLATTTQLSDFVAKYSMSKHLQANGTDINASIIEASKTFINYDVPTSQGLQYANDMGLFMFTKFFLRIQAVLMKLLGKRAGSVIAQHLLVENLTGAEGILSPMAFGHIGNNPIESSVLGLPSAFFSIGTVDAVTDVGTSF